jgi:hypothetical protein
MLVLLGENLVEQLETAYRGTQPEYERLMAAAGRADELCRPPVKLIDGAAARARRASARAPAVTKERGVDLTMHPMYDARRGIMT